MRLTLLSAIALFATTLTASATTITYSGTGQFSNITGCNAGFPSCSVNSVGGGHNNQLSMSGFSLFGPSTLTAVSTSGSYDITKATTVVLGKIDWINNATIDTDPNFDATYTFSLAFTAPNSSKDSQSFALDIQQKSNPQGDEVLDLSNSTLAGLGPFDLTGISMSNLRFVLASGSDGKYNGTNWTNPEGHASELLIETDLAPSAVTPEPSSIALLGTGLLGVAGMLKRRIA